MCIIVDDPKRGTSYGSLRDFRAAGFVIERDDWFDPEFDPADAVEPENACLCSVDAEAIIRRAGLPFRIDFMGDIIIGDICDRTASWQLDGQSLVWTCSVTCPLDHPWDQSGDAGAPSATRDESGTNTAGDA